jgi:mono/diheme cytochrome c family protein
MWTTGYGLTLAAKLLLIVPLLLIAAYHHALASNDWLARRLAPLLASLRPGETARTLRAESFLSVAVLVATAVLAATPPPIPASAGIDAESPSQTAHLDETGDLAVAVAVDPGAPGANSYEVTITHAGEPISGAQVWLRLVFPALDWRSRLLALDDAGSGLYVGVGTEFDRAGRWQMQVDMLLPSAPPEQARRAAFWWELPDAPPALFIREPTLFNWLGAGLVAAAFGALLGPGVARRIRALRLQPEAVAVGMVALVATLVILVLGGVALANSLADLDARRNPPPPVVNPTLADAESLALGQTVFEAHCAECHGPPSTGFIQVPAGSPPSLRTLVETRRDAAIFETITRGRGEMPPIDIPEAARWAVINYLRGPAFHASVPGTGD